MGAFFTNYQVRSNSTPAVKEVVERIAKSRAYVSPEQNGWVTVYDESSDEQNEEVITGFAAELSRSLATAVLACLVHDSDVAVYWLYQNGALADEFNSAPDYFGSEVDDRTHARVRGKPEALLPLCTAGTAHSDIAAVIHPTDGLPLMAEGVFTDLARLLGIDEARLSLGFGYFEEEGEDILPDADAFEPVGRKATRKKSRPRTEVQTPPAAIPDMFPVAIGMLTQCWSAKHEQQMAAFHNILSATGQTAPGMDKMLKQLRDGLDRGARDFLKQSQLPGCPTIEELKAARDSGPETLARLLAKRTPTMLADIGESAVREELEQFVAALLAAGMDPNAKGFHGRTVLSAGEKLGLNSRIYLLLKSAVTTKP